MKNVKSDNSKARNAYKAPQLKMYGGVTTLTASGSNKTNTETNQDPAQPNKNRP